MKCAITGCPGEYELKEIVHTVRPDGRVVVIDHVPADVCSVCGDILLAPATVRRIKAILHSGAASHRVAPVYEFAS